jgi:hypothetical protein
MTVEEGIVAGDFVYVKSIVWNIKLFKHLLYVTIH